MKKDVIQIVIYSNDIELAKKFNIAVKQESKYFKEETKIISKKEELDIVKDINILMILISDKKENELKNYKSKKIKNKAEKVVIVNMKERIVVEKDIIKIMGKNQDEKAIAFSILYDYSIELKNKIEEDELSYNQKMLDETMEKFNTDDSQEKVFSKIDEIVMENRANYSIGYETLKIMIYFCIVNDINIDPEQKYNYFYKAIARIFNENVNVVIKNIGSTLNLIRKRKKKLKIQEKLEEIKGKQVIEQIILISKIVKQNL